METKVQNELVILVHGILSGPIWMVVLNRRLRQAGFTTMNWGYRSWLGDIESHAARLSKQLQDADERYTKVHVVAHSMGCIVTRVALIQRPITKLGQVLFLTPPHRGSVIARRIGPWVRWICPAASQLSDRSDSFVCNLTPPTYPFAVVSADYDLVVAKKSTYLEPCIDRFSVGTMHNGVLFSRYVAEQTIHFLRNARFNLPRAANELTQHDLQS